MFDQVVLWLEQYPYFGVAAVFLLCGLGLPLPEEIVLLAAGYVCAKLDLNLGLMMAWCGGAILLGDVLPFLLGRTFGKGLLRIRWVRYIVNKRRLATFDLWFRRRGDLVILIARFVAGLRVVAFFTAGVMKMPWRRFLIYDGIGILLIVPLLTWLGHSSREFIDEMIENVQQVERGILWAVIGGGVVLALSWWIWRWRARRKKAERGGVGEAFVQPSRPIAGDENAETDRDTGATAASDKASEAIREPAADPEPDPDESATPLQNGRLPENSAATPDDRAQHGDRTDPDRDPVPPGSESDA
ncbi:MAG: DedA family protein [bacterium]|nr:DedA family protein [bacterium]